MSASATLPLVLVIEDDTVLLSAMTDWLKAEGYRVMAAADGGRGLDLFRQMKADIVVTDIIMPEREGIETLMALKALAPETPILAISGGGRVPAGDFLTLAKSLGADGVLAKPFRREAFLERVRTVASSESAGIGS